MTIATLDLDQEELRIGVELRRADLSAESRTALKSELSKITEVKSERDRDASLNQRVDAHLKSEQEKAAAKAALDAQIKALKNARAKLLPLKALAQAVNTNCVKAGGLYNDIDETYISARRSIEPLLKPMVSADARPNFTNAMGHTLRRAGLPVRQVSIDHESYGIELSVTSGVDDLVFEIDRKLRELGVKS